MRATGLRLLFACLVLATAFVAFGETPATGVADRFTPSLNKARKDHGRLVQHNCRAHGNQIRPLVCYYGPKDSDTRVVLFGDSHALQWGPALIPLAQQRGWRLITLLRAGCPIANIKTEKHCAKWRGRAIHKISTLRPRHIIISTSTGARYRLKHRNLNRQQSEGLLRAAMVRTIKKLKRVDTLANNKHAIKLIRDQVLAPFVPAECLKKNNGRARKCAFRNKRRWGPGFDWVAAKRTGILPAIDPTKALCGPKWCSVTKGRILKYRDSDHLTATYVRTLSGWLGKRLGIK